MRAVPAVVLGRSTVSAAILVGSELGILQRRQSPKGNAPARGRSAGERRIWPCRVPSRSLAGDVKRPILAGRHAGRERQARHDRLAVTPLALQCLTGMGRAPVASDLPGWARGYGPLRCQPPPPRATRLSTCRVSLPVLFGNSTSVPSPPAAA